MAVERETVLNDYAFESCDGSKGYLSYRRKASHEEITNANNLYKTMN